VRAILIITIGDVITHFRELTLWEYRKDEAK